MFIAKVRKYYVPVALVLVGAYAGYRLYLWWLRTEPVDKAAENILRAYESRNTSVLWYYSDASEKDALHLDRAKFDAFFESYVWPVMSDLRRTHRDYDLSKKGDLYSMTQHYDKSGNDIFLDYVVFATPSGPKANVVAPAIMAVFQIKYGAKHKNVTGMAKLYRIRADGIRADKKTLEGLGIMGLKDSSPGSPMGRWDWAQAVFEKYGYGEASPGLPPVP